MINAAPYLNLNKQLVKGAIQVIGDADGLVEIDYRKKTILKRLCCNM